jgi:hypothetical protein
MSEPTVALCRRDSPQSPSCADMISGRWRWFSTRERSASETIESPSTAPSAPMTVTRASIDEPIWSMIGSMLSGDQLIEPRASP